MPHMRPCKVTGTVPTTCPPQQNWQIHLTLTSQHINKVLQVVAVHWANVVETQLLKQRAACAANHATGILVNLGSRVLDDAGQLLGDPLGDLTQLAQLPVGLNGATVRARSGSVGV